MDRDSSPVASAFDDRTTDPELAKYLNRDYWEQRGNTTSNGHAQLNELAQSMAPANPTAPTPTATPTPQPSLTSFTTSLNVITIFFYSFSSAFHSNNVAN